MIARYLLFWLILAVVAIANGVLRQAGYGRYLSELAAHQLTTVTGILLTGGDVRILNRIWPIGSAREARIIGASWFIMTEIFEFGCGPAGAGPSWSHLFADYNLLAGRVWLLFLAWLLMLPYVIWLLGNR